jgi:WD40 repeat protein
MPSDGKFPTTSTPVVLSDERQEMVDAWGRRAGAALRVPASESRLEAIQRRARNRRVVHAAGAVVGVIATVAAITLLVQGDNSANELPLNTEPDATVPETAPTSRPSTTLLPAGAPLVVTPGVTAEIRNSLQYVQKFAYNSDGTVLAGIGAGFALRLFNPETLAVTRELACPTSLATDGSGSLAWSQPVAATWDSQSRSLKTAMASPPGFGGDCEMAFSPDGSRAARAASMDTTILWNASAGLELAVLDGVSPVFSRDSSFVLTFTATGTKVWDSLTGAARADLGGDSTWAVFSADGTRFVTIGSEGADLWDTASLSRVATLNPVRSGLGPFVDATFTADGTRVATANSRSASIWDTTNGEELVRIDRQSGALNYVTFSPDDTLLATGGSQEEALRVFDAGNGQELANLYEDDVVAGYVAFSPDGRTMAVSVTPTERPTQRGLHLWNYSRG